MQSELAFLLEGVTMTGDIHNDVAALLTYYGREVTLEHSGRVAREAKRLATLWGANPEDTEVAGWLHDISAVIPNVQRIPLSERLGLEILPEERLFPMIIHQKLSVVMARDLFGIRNEAILSAIGCHTTLKAKASLLDKIVFVADKIQWDQSGDPPYLQELLTAVEESMDRAAAVYLGHLWDNRDKLKVLHPWARDAYFELRGT